MNNYYEVQEEKAFELIECWLAAIKIGFVIWVICDIVWRVRN